MAYIVHPKILLSAGGVDSLLAAALTFFRVVPVVAPLAECGEVQEVRRFGAVIKDMSHRQHHFRACHRMRLIVLAPAPFTPIRGAVEAHESAPKFPVFRIAVFVFGEDRHRW